MLRHLGFKYWVFMFGLVGVLLTACQSLPTSDLAPSAEDIKAKQFDPVADKASVYIYRDELNNGYIPVPIQIDGKTIANTRSMTFAYQLLPPGKYRITAQADNVGVLDIEVEAGKIYYVWQQMVYSNSGDQVRTMLMMTNETRGKKGVLASKLVLPPVIKAADGEQIAAVPTVIIPASSANEPRSKKVDQLNQLFDIRPVQDKALTEWRGKLRGTLEGVLVQKWITHQKKDGQALDKTKFEPQIQQQLKSVSNEQLATCWDAQYMGKLSDKDLDTMLAYYSSPNGQQELKTGNVAVNQLNRVCHSYLDQQFERSVEQFSSTVDLVLGSGMSH